MNNTRTMPRWKLIAQHPIFFSMLAKACPKSRSELRDICSSPSRMLNPTNQVSVSLGAGRRGSEVFQAPSLYLIYHQHTASRVAFFGDFVKSHHDRLSARAS